MASTPTRTKTAVGLQSGPDIYRLLDIARREAAALMNPLPSDQEIHQQIAAILHGPKAVWSNATGGSISQDKAAALLLADLELWMISRSGRSDQQPRVDELTALIPEVRRALFGG